MTDRGRIHVSSAPVAAEELLRGHRGLLALELDADEADGTLPGGDDEPITLRLDHPTRPPRSRLDPRLVDDQPDRLARSAIPDRRGDRPGLHGADEVVDRLPGPGPVDPAVLLLELRGLRRGRRVLRDDRRGAADEGLDCLDDQRRPDRGQPILDLARRLVGPDRRRREREHPARVDSRGHPDHGHARLGFAVLDRPRVGRSQQ